MIKIPPFEALGTVWWFRFYEDISEDLENSIKALLKDFNDECSRFKKDSQLSLLNSERILKNPSNRMMFLIQKGLEYYSLTEGVFNFTQGNILERRGYDSSYSFSEKEQVESNTPPKDLINISDDTIRLNGIGNIDFGGFGKGYIIDTLVEYLKKRGLQYFMINGGGDIYCTCDQDGNAIPILLENPKEIGKGIAQVSLQNNALCASSPIKRSWKTQNGNEYSHIVSQEDSHISSTFVIGDTAMDADMLATTLSIRSDTEFIQALKKSIHFGYKIC